LRLRKELLQQGLIFLNVYLQGNKAKMKTNYLRYFIFLGFITSLSWTLSCSGGSGKAADSLKPSPDIATEAAAKLIKLVSPEENTGFKLNDPVKVVLATVDNNKLPDSVLIYFDSKLVKNIKSEPWEYSIPSAFTSSTGRKSLKVSAYKGGKPQNTITRFMIVYSDIVPKRYGYKVLHTYPHDRAAFTQGLVYENGTIYEGTGQEAGSSLREVNLETGNVIRQHNLEGSLFGEGIAIYGDRIFQVTWENKVGFVYDKATFKQKNKIYYSTQGWGLTTLNDKIVMSDGTNVLYFFDPESFTVVSRIEVYDNKEKIDSLNELEYIDGEIWANIWMTDKIVRIDPQSGKVLGFIDLKGILNDPETDTSVNVLNGIAYDKDGHRVFVTGKNWPKLFEIKVIE
jgi:glutamine cyclotransferase